MKTELEIAVSYKEVTKKKVNIDLPEYDLFFQKGSLGDSDCEIFAICLYGDNAQSGHYNLMRVKGNGFQDTTDFIPLKDMNDSYWVDGQGFRKLALSLILGSEFIWFTISKQDFISAREHILNFSINKIIRNY